mmetsp:Transcript_28720/g.54324  ORF Transcript_28720/g.54324 Transcript_28720/m.54324 type:complete len:206 (+) Transcript_28720:774-1391(+)
MGHEIWGNVLMHDDPARRVAALANVEIDAKGHRIRRTVEVRIRANHLRVLATQLQRHLLQGPRRGPCDQLAHRCGSRKGHHVHVFVGRHHATHGLTVAQNDVAHARRQSRVGQQLPHHHGRGRRHLGRFHNDRASRRQRKGQLLRQDPEREIPGRDDGHHANRLFENNAKHFVAQRVVTVPMHSARQRRRIAPEVGSAPNLAARL